MSKQILISITVMICLVIIGIGVKVYMDNREERKAQELLAVEKQSVQVLKNTFADIAEVEIEHFVRNEKTGTYGGFIIMTNTNGESVSFDYLFSKNSMKIEGYGLENEKV